MNRTHRAFVLVPVLASLVRVASAATFSVTNTSDSGAGSLRQAIADANSGGPGPHTITFDIPGSGVHTIVPATGLPFLSVASGGVTIDGTTQPGYAGSPLIQVTCGAIFSGFTVDGAGGGTIKGLAIGGCLTAVTADTAVPVTVQACHIGTDATGTVAAPNGEGIEVAAAILTIGGPSASDGNLISGNGGHGINMNAGGGTIQNNKIGTDVTGTVALPNVGNGINTVLGVSNVPLLIGGPGAGNLISGNTMYGIQVNQHPDVTIQGNSIGTDASGTAAIANGIGGIDFGGANFVVGGTGAGEGNLVSGNPIGLDLDADGMVVQGNFVGVDASHTLALPNTGIGIRVTSSPTPASPSVIGSSTPGGPGGNLIAFNGGQGLVVSSGTRNTIRGNSIHDNFALGISLLNGAVNPTANDAGDADTGPNDMQNFPLVSSVTYGANTTVSGLLSSTPNTTFDLDFYSNAACSNFPRDYLEGETYLGSSQVTTDGSGNAPFTVSTLPSVASGSKISVTATDPSGNTSEFSQRLPFFINVHSGPASGGTGLDISGTNFLPDASVTIGGVSATGVSVHSSTSISLLTSPLAAGTANDLVVTNTDATAGTLVKAFVADFLDVPSSQQFYSFVTTLVSNAITAGIGGGLYGVNDDTLRQQMAVFILKGKHGLCYTPPDCAGMFSDVPCPSTFANWIEAMANEGITGGCGGGQFCPQAPVRRDQMAVFLLKGEHGSSYAPPACAGVFADVPCPSTFANWIEQLSNEGITGGCGGGNYCPSNPNTRGQMAVFLVKTFNLTQ
jgi:hypothetical protein